MGPTAPGEPGIFTRHALGFGVALYAAAALADTWLTLEGIGGSLAMEGNPMMRAVMASLGPTTGLIAQKAAVGAAAIFIAAAGRPAIRNRSAWIDRVPSTRWARAWMRSGDRSWIALIPLYVATCGQVLAALSWSVLYALS